MEENKLKAYRSKRTSKSSEPEISQKQKLSQELKKISKLPETEITQKQKSLQSQKKISQINKRKKNQITSDSKIKQPIKLSSRIKQPIFVVQKHDASHLHYDFRLEIGDVLVSWAIPKIPPIEVGEKRLAIPTEDHPLEYANFEGIIPEGEYGTGTVEIWDHGTYENIKHKNGDIIPISTCLKNGQLEIFLNGEKMNGPYALIKTTLGGKEQWLILKMKERA